MFHGLLCELPRPVQPDWLSEYVLVQECDLVAIMSAAVKAARAFAAVKADRAFAWEGRAQIASTVDRTNIAGLVERVVDSARVDHGRGRSWAVLRAMTTLLVTGHAAQNKRKISVHQEPLILKACSSAF